jgi:hypothetical protein
MAKNFLEQLLAEWYELQGYFIRKNVLVGKRPQGGHDCELDVVAFHPTKKHLVHIEASMDASSWDDRERRFKKKFDAGKKHIPLLFSGLDIPTNIDQVAVLVFASKQKRDTLAGGKLILWNDLMKENFEDLQNRSIFSQAIPKQFPILRAFQFVAQYRKEICSILKIKEA